MVNGGVQISQLQSLIRLSKYLSCYDFRSELKELSRKYGAHERAIRKYVSEMRRARIPASPIIVWGAFGLEYGVMLIKGSVKPEVARKLYSMMPYLRLIRVLFRGVQETESMIIVNAPHGRVGEALEIIAAELGESSRIITSEKCSALPIYTCPLLSVTRVEPSSLAGEKLGEWEEKGYREALAVLRSRLPSPIGLGIAFAVLLDAEPLAQRQEIVNKNVVKELAVREGAEWLSTVVRRYGKRLGMLYDAFSATRVIGRVVVWGLNDSAPILLAGRVEHAPLIHLLASAYGLTNGILVCEEGVYTTVPARMDVVRVLRYLRGQGVDVVFVEEGYRFPIRIRLWDEKKGAWLWPPSI